MPDIARNAPHFIPWLALVGVFWSTIFLEFPGIKAYLGRGWFGGFFATLLLAALGPALYLGLGALRGQPFPLTAGGIVLSPPPFARPFTPQFFLLCAAIGIVAGLIKWALLSRFTAARRGVAFVVMLLTFSTLGTTAAVSEMSVDPARAVATLYRLAGVKNRQPAGKTMDPIQNAQPLLDYYRSLGKQTKKE